MLLSDASDADIARLDADVALAQIRLERLELAELELQDRIAAARDGSERQRRAGELERAAAAIESKVAALNSAINALATAFTDLAGTIPGDSGILVDADHMTRPATARRRCERDLSAGMFNAAPSAFEMVQPRLRSARPASVERLLNVAIVNKDGVLTRYLKGLCGEEATVPPTAAAAEQIIVAPLRDKARALRDSADLAQAAE